jgi:hypothetical protein
MTEHNIEDWEENTGETFDPEGPPLSDCEHCGELSQYSDQHDCAGLRAENADAAWFEDAAYGRPD